MRKYLLPSALILIFGLCLAVAQNINKAIQLSQDASGAFGVDTNNNVYFPGHLLSVGPGVPVLTSCGTTPAIVGTDTAGQVTTGTTSAGCAITFNKVYLATPWCVVASQNGLTPTWAAWVTGIVVALATNTNTKVNYLCSGSS